MITRQLSNIMSVRRLLQAAAVVVFVAGAAQSIGAQEELEQQASWQVPTPLDIKAQIDDFLTGRQLDDVLQAKIAALWPATPAPENPIQLLDQVAATLALVDESGREVVEFCRTEVNVVAVPTFAVLQDESQAPFVRHNLRLLFGKWLAQNRFYDEALEQLNGLTANDVVDPAALLFYQCAGYHRMPNKKECLPIAAKLLENQDKIPRRYATLARLIQADIEPLKADSLDEISRLMDEVQRRLALKRAGVRVRNQEDEVIAKLDKLIKKLEEQQQQQQQSAASGSLVPSNPAQDSVPMGGTGPGNVDPKSIGTKSGWGNLPPKERQEALQQIGKDLPAHYREVIEEYFRKLARESRT